MKTGPIAAAQQWLQRRLQSQQKPQQPPTAPSVVSISASSQRSRQFVFGPECNPLEYAMAQEWEDSQSRLSSRGTLVFALPYRIDDADFVSACKECAAVFARMAKGETK